MATLQRIRNRTGLLLTVIGVAMLAFVLGDVSTFFGSDESPDEYAGKVLGKDVSLKDYKTKVNERKNSIRIENRQIEFTPTIEEQIRSEVWNEYVRELVMNNEYLKLGIDVSDEEWIERLSGQNVHPEIIKIFPSLLDTATGKFNGQGVKNEISNIAANDTSLERKNQKAQWIRIQKNLLDILKNEKYNSLISKAMYVTNQEAKVKFNEKSQNVTFNYVEIPLISVADSTVKPTESEIKTYYTKHKSSYKQDASKDVDFVVFSVTPSAEDDAKTKSEIEGLKVDFSRNDDYEWLRSKSENTTARFTFATKEELEMELDTNWTKLFTTEEGTVIGPYQASKGVYRIAKLAVAQERPDSVEVRHIFMKPTQTMDADSVKARINAIKSQVEAGADFGILAQKNSEDKASANTKGGDLGWFSEGATLDKFLNQEIIELSRNQPRWQEWEGWQPLIDSFNVACFESKIEDLKVVESLFGFHLIEITNRSNLVPKVKISFIDIKVEPSPITREKKEEEANQFVDKIVNKKKKFDLLVENLNLDIREDYKVTADRQNINGLPNSREIVRWMRTAKKGALSEVFRLENQYVVAYLKKIYTKGFRSLEDIDVKVPIKALVVKEKKAAHIIANIQAADLVTIAANHGQVLVSEQKANLSNSIFQGSYEPELVGSIFGTPVGSISNPIEGSNAVYVIEVTAKDDKNTTVDFTQIKQEVQKGAAAYAIEAAYKVLKAKAEVKDNLSVIY